MPIFHDPDLLLASNRKEPIVALTPQPAAIVMRKPSEESIRTEFCDGPVPDSPSWIKSLENKALTMAQEEEDNKRTSDRVELMERIKRGESPTWVPSQTLEGEKHKQESELSPSPSPKIKRKRSIVPLLPPLEIPGPREKSKSPQRAFLSPPEKIQRPKSALHTGNFTEGSQGVKKDFAEPPNSSLDTSRKPLEGALGTSPTTPWYSPVAQWRRSAAHGDIPIEERDPEWPIQRAFRSRAPSLHSYSSSYILKPPTTPLVQQSNSNDIDESLISPITLSESPTRDHRRHTLPPHALSTPSLPDMSSSQSAYQPLSNRIDDHLSYQRHRPRRSLTEKWSLQVASSQHSARPPGSRRLSSSSEISSRHRASMVGSYEESILRGSMSTPPSKPLDFTAQIGVLGGEKCKPKHPAHVTVPFPAVFYSYGSVTGRRNGADEPSPYVGEIDLQHNLPQAEPERGRRKRRHSPKVKDQENSHMSTERSPVKSDHIGDANLQVRKRKKNREDSPPPEVPPGGSYRIPQRGQLQIVIKNPNKTAVKLFLVPYDLTDMEAGTKTFIRQRCYCTGAVADGSQSSKSDMSTGSPSRQAPNEKPFLRYQIQVKICSPSKDRFYLYHVIRVVFANRVPDNKEQLQNDIQLPDPRYSAYKPSNEPLTPLKAGTGPQLLADKAYRRRSTGFGSEPGGLENRYPSSAGGHSNYPFANGMPAPPVPPIPFDLVMSKPKLNGNTPEMDTSRPTTATDSQSPISDRKGHVNGLNVTGSLRSNSSNESGNYTKLQRTDASNGGVYGRPSTPEPGEGLLARRLRGLEFQKSRPVFDDD